MKESFEKFQSTEETELLNRINNFFPEGKTTEININDLPVDVLNFFEGYSKRFILPEEYVPGNFKKLFLADHENGDKTYIANQTKIYTEGDDGGGGEDLSYLVDYRANEIIGHSELRFKGSSGNKYYQDKPFIGFTDTEEKHRKSGLGKRRLYLMNALAKSFYGHSVYSDTLVSEEARLLWEKLVLENKAQKIKEGDKDRYRLVD